MWFPFGPAHPSHIYIRIVSLFQNYNYYHALSLHWYHYHLPKTNIFEKPIFYNNLETSIGLLRVRGLRGGIKIHHDCRYITLFIYLSNQKVVFKNFWPTLLRAKSGALGCTTILTLYNYLQYNIRQKLEEKCKKPSKISHLWTDCKEIWHSDGPLPPFGVSRNEFYVSRYT